MAWHEGRNRFEINDEPLNQPDGATLSYNPIALQPDLSGSLSGQLTSDLEGLSWPDVAHGSVFRFDDPRLTSSVPRRWSNWLKR